MDSKPEEDIIELDEKPVRFFLFQGILFWFMMWFKNTHLLRNVVVKSGIANTIL